MSDSKICVEHFIGGARINIEVGTAAEAVSALDALIEWFDKGQGAEPAPKADTAGAQHDGKVSEAAKVEEQKVKAETDADELERQRQKREAAAKAKAAETDDNNPWDDDPEPAEVTLDDLRSVAGALGRERGIALLKKHGAKAPKLSALPESAWAAFHAEAKELLDGE